MTRDVHLIIGILYTSVCVCCVGRLVVLFVLRVVIFFRGLKPINKADEITPTFSPAVTSTVQWSN